MRISIPQATKLLTTGHVVAVPTETVYGLAACLDHPQAIDQIFSLKGRPSNNPLIVHLSSPKQIRSYAGNVPGGLDLLAKAFWPGPLTVVLPIEKDTVPSKARAGLPTAAFRIPGHPSALKLIEQSGPLVMPSANLSGKPSATTAEHVEEDFGHDFPVLEGGPCAHGLESTIIILVEGRWNIARLGALSAQDIESVLGYLPPTACHGNGEKPLCPGQLYRHYSPKAQLKPVQHFSANMCGAVVGYSDRDYPPQLRVYSLGLSDDPAGVAENLYAVLRRLDQNSEESAYLDIDIPSDGLWATIMERLHKASQ